VGAASPGPATTSISAGLTSWPRARRFDPASCLTSFAGCNDYNASYKASAPKLSIGPVASTRKHCEEPAGVSEQETRYLAALKTAATYRVGLAARAPSYTESSATSPRTRFGEPQIARFGRR
jgi:META domain